MKSFLSFNDKEHTPPPCNSHTKRFLMYTVNRLIIPIATTVAVLMELGS